MELVRQRKRRGRAEVTHAEGGQQLRQGALLRGVDLGNEILSARRADAIELHQLIDRERVQVSGVAHEACGGELLHHLFAESLDVHAASRREVSDLLIALGGAIGGDAARVGFTFGTDERVAATRAVRREHPWRAAFGPQRQHRSHDFGDHVAGLADHHRVAGAHVFHRHLVLVVQGGHANGGATDEHRLEHGERRRPTCAAHRHHDAAQQRGAFFRGKLVRDRPTRCPRGHTQPLALRDVVELDDHAVDLVVEIVTVILPMQAVCCHLVDGGERTDVVVHSEPEAGGELQHGDVARELRPTDHFAELIAEEREVPTRCDRRILLTQAASGRVAWVDERLLPCGDGALVELFEARSGHVDLATHLDHRRRADGEIARNVVDRGDIGGDVFTDASVAARRGLHEPAVLVPQADGQAVELQLAHERRCCTIETFGHPISPGSEFVAVHRVVEAHHRNAVGDRRERRADRCAHETGR